MDKDESGNGITDGERVVDENASEEKPTTPAPTAQGPPSAATQQKDTITDVEDAAGIAALRKRMQKLAQDIRAIEIHAQRLIGRFLRDKEN